MTRFNLRCCTEQFGVRYADVERLAVKKLGKVSATFNISGRGCIVACEFVGHIYVKTGQAVELRRQGAITFSSVITGVVAPNLSQPTTIALLVKGLEKNSVDIGDEIWLEDAAFEKVVVT